MIGCILAYTLVLVFRIGDDLADLRCDRLHHPNRVLVQSSSLKPIVVFALVIAAGDSVMMLFQPRPGKRIAVFAALSLVLFLWYRQRTPLRAGPLFSAHVVLVKYPVIALLTWSNWDQLTLRTALSSTAALYLGMCIYEQVHDRTVRQTRGANWIFAAEMGLLLVVPLTMLSIGGFLW